MPNDKKKKKGEDALSGLASGLALKAGVPYMLPKAYRGHKEADPFHRDPRTQLINFAEDPAYAEAFARGPGEAVMEADLAVKNALDLTPKNAGDWYGGSQGAMTERDIRKLIPFLQMDRPDYRDLEGELRAWKFGDPATDEAFQARQNITFMLERLLGRNPGALKAAGFDGLKYLDGVAPAWAIPDVKQVLNYVKRIK